MEGKWVRRLEFPYFVEYFALSCLLLGNFLWSFNEISAKVFDSKTQDIVFIPPIGFAHRFDNRSAKKGSLFLWANYLMRDLRE